MENNQIVNLNNLDVAYSSKSDKELKKAHLLFLLMNNQGLTNVGTFFIKLLFEFKFPIKRVIKNTMFAHFCGGEVTSETYFIQKNKRFTLYQNKIELMMYI